jgi:hypothetical protein
MVNDPLHGERCVHARDIHVRRAADRGFSRRQRACRHRDGGTPARRNARAVLPILGKCRFLKFS